ncbi:MAG: ABC transporter substrate-binding protein [Desulfitobacteriaceae bacterium]|nr:ABC transporter substrate-binding protein [Desulfitobacteriaceae bacterium]MDI6879751.1 ABC transporter substrate-binding protein [Desulfitobacteriaceae bacterium]MDI6913303.1 ABC transporter substrate-binding protein [Desulfitobacteriaceae bacterium]
MKLSRQYLLGLGSGLILSALISLVFPSISVLMGHGSGEGGTAASRTGSLVPGAAPPSGTSPSGDSVVPLPSVSFGTPSQADKISSREFMIPGGASAEKIASLLLAQGFITNKKAFLDAVEKKRAASRFQAGTFTLGENLSAEEIVDALLAQKGR